MIKVNRKVQYGSESNFDGNIHLQDLTGSAQLSENDPFDQDAMSIESGGFLNASGRLRGKLANIGKNRQKNKAARRNLINKFIDTKGKTSLENAKAQTLAAKNAGKTDPALVAALNQPTPTPTTPIGMSTGAKVAIGIGIAALIGVTIFIIKKKKK